MSKQITIVLISFLFFFFALQAQSELRKFRIMGYNVENYFDTEDDPNTNDEEYLPGGYRGWNTTKYRHKQASISKVIAAVGGWEAPEIVVLSEIESRKAMEDLTEQSPLKSMGYKFVHHESPDPRGIDVAIMYQPHRFKPFHEEIIRINSFRTRDILYVAGRVVDGDTLHLFACHFPSRWGGELESESRRVEVAQRLRSRVDSLFVQYHNPNIIIMGDLNDNPSNVSVLKGLQALPPQGKYDAHSLYNLAYPFHERNVGSHKFQGEWSMIDHIIISGNLLQESNGTSTKPENFHIFEADFLLEKDEQFLGVKPFRTYIGMRYHGGYSDHLPIFVDLWY